jgi:hypothetical protein
MNSLSRALVRILAVAATVSAASFAMAADQGIFGIFGGGPPPAPPPGPPLDLAAPSPLAGMYVPVAPPGMVTYPGYNSTYPNTGCRGAYWARKPIFNADGLLIGYTRPQFMCPQWY